MTNQINEVSAEVSNEVPAETSVEVSTEVSVDTSNEVPAEVPTDVSTDVVVATTLAPKVSLVSQIIKTMNDNADKSMKDVVDIMVATLPLKQHRKLASARSYYRELVEAGRATGNIESQKGVKAQVVKTNQAIVAAEAIAEAIAEAPVVPTVTIEEATAAVAVTIAKLKRARAIKKAA